MSIRDKVDFDRIKIQIETKRKLPTTEINVDTQRNQMKGNSKIREKFIQISIQVDLP